MSSEHKIKTTSDGQTSEIGKFIGASLKGGEVFELIGDLGAGKTTFTKGLAAGVGSSDDASSPTFTVSKIYSAKNIKIHHYDFYRLPEVGLMMSELQEVIDDPGSVVVIEWAGEASKQLPPGRLIRIEFTPDPVDENCRYLTICAGAEVPHVIVGLDKEASK